MMKLTELARSVISHILTKMEVLCGMWPQPYPPPNDVKTLATHSQVPNNTSVVWWLD